jgi:hypothetical protein
MKLAHYFSFFFLTIIISCTKPPDYPIEPVIKFERLSRNFMDQGFTNNDSVVVTISFTDGDGDLGNNDPTIDIFVKDIRVVNADPSPYKMPFVPVQGVGNGISGEISILTYSTCCLFNDVYSPCTTTEPAVSLYPIDTLIYEIYIVDRAGHESNRVLSDPIFLQCDVN